MKNLWFVILIAACGGDDPGPACTTAACGNGLTYQQCLTAGSTQVRYLLGAATCTCPAITCSDCTTLIANYCDGSVPNTNGSTNGSGLNGSNGSTNGSGLNGSNGSTNGTTGGSCRAGGSSCQSFTDCCSGTCANQVCTSCAGSGESCNGVACCGSLQCYQGVCGNCRADGTSCNLASDCCSNICHLGSCQSCAAMGGSCTNNAECCGGVACISGVCGGPDPACVQQGAANCPSCCYSNHTTGGDKYSQLAFACLCQGGPCVTVCMANICNSSSDDPVCDSCFTTSCQTSTQASCGADADCRDYLNCFNACS